MVVERGREGKPGGTNPKGELRSPGQAGRRTPRSIAFDILRRVEGGGYASDLLLEHTAGLDSRDAGLVSAIVFGVLRYRAQLDYLIDYYAGRSRKLDPEVRIALRMGIYQLRWTWLSARGLHRRRASSMPCCAR
jgi:16S rRNA (cytosine967-C5)-methyltransferase